MRPAFKKYLFFHLALLAFAVGFYFYGTLMSRLFPSGFYHCPLHDVLGLYCPFCGGTRAFFFLLKGDFRSAFAANAFLLCFSAFWGVLDLIVFIFLLQGREVAGIFRPCFCFSLFSGLLFAAVRNAAMLCGYDPVGDLAPLWAGRLPLPAIWAACTLIFAFSGALFFYLWRPRRLRRLLPGMGLSLALVGLLVFYRLGGC